MDIMTKLKHAIGKGPAIPLTSLKKLQGISKEQATLEMAGLLHDLCMNRSALFVKYELDRKDSPFKGLSKFIFFHEIIAMSFWIVRYIFGMKKENLTRGMHNAYFKYFNFDDEGGVHTDILEKRYAAYAAEWDEITGHYDLFAEKAAEFIFKDIKGLRVREISFLIIEYADSLIKSCTELKKICSRLGLKFI